MTLLRRLVLLFLAVKLGNLGINLFCFPVLRPNSTSTAREPVSLLVPVRNEAGRLAETLPAILSQNVDELLILDDCSTDDSAAMIEALIAAAPHARLIGGAAPPDGWVGKTWACHQLSEHARNDVLIFCDSDVILAPHAIECARAQQQADGADVFSVFPQQRTGSLGEHLTVPIIDDVLLCFLPYPLLSRDIASAATANGSLIAMDRRTYDGLGGFAAVRESLIEDVALARRARRQHRRLGLALGGDVVMTRMYQDYRGVREAFGRNLLPAAGGSRLLLLLAMSWHLMVYTLPVLLLGRDRRWALPVAGALIERCLIEHKTGRRRYWQCLLMPATPLAVLPVIARSLRREHSWRGRSYLR